MSCPKRSDDDKERASKILGMEHDIGVRDETMFLGGRCVAEK
jgi:hypothetical protein